MLLPKDNARELAEQIALGNRQAEHELVVACYSSLLSHLQRRLSGRAVAEDICQESFIIAIQRLRRGDIRDFGKVCPFLTGIAERLILVHARATRTGTTNLDADALETFEPPPLETLERTTEGAVIRKAVSELRCRRDRELLLRRYWLDQNGPEIQQSLELTPVVFKKAISRARSRVRRLLKRETC